MTPPAVTCHPEWIDANHRHDDTSLANKAKKRNQILAIDLGSRATKAVLLDRKQDSFSLSRYAITDAPIYEKGIPQGLLTEHLRSLVDRMSPKTRQVTLAVGSEDSVLRSTEMPLLPLSDMRQMLKFNAKNYLQQDLRDYVFDCYIVPPSSKAAQEAGKPAAKYKVWVGGARREWLANLEGAVKAAGLWPTKSPSRSWARSTPWNWPSRRPLPRRSSPWWIWAFAPPPSAFSTAAIFASTAPWKLAATSSPPDWPKP